MRAIIGRFGLFLRTPEPFRFLLQLRAQRRERRLRRRLKLFRQQLRIFRRIITTVRHVDIVNAAARQIARRRSLKAGLDLF